MNNFPRGKRLLGLLLVLTLLWGLVPLSFADSYPFTAFVKDDLRLRKTASSSGTILLVMPKGDAVLVVGESGNYYIVQYEGTQGYALKSYITTSAVVPAATALTAATQTPSKNAQENYTALRSGATGTAVKALQQALTELGFYTSSVDSKYGSGTQSAVSAFQKMNGLSETGVADQNMQELLYEGTPKNVKGTKTDVKTLPPVDGWTIRQGDKGDAVEALQSRLKALSYYNGEITGVCSAATVTAIKAFQKKNGLKQDGAAGEKTLEVLWSMDAVAADATATPKPTKTPSPAPTAKATAQSATYPYTTTTNDAVNLRKTASKSGTRITTVPANAQITVLRDAGSFLEITYGDKTGYVMEEYVNVPERYLPGNTLSTDSEAQANYTALSQGSTGTKVKALQQALTELGFYTGSVDSIFGSGMKTAVQAMQQKNGLAQSGIASPELQKLIFEGTPKNNKGVKTSVRTLPPIDGYTMRQGDQGDAVQALQRTLTRLALYTGACDGVYTAEVVAAVKVFQQANGMTADGVAGAETQAALAKAQNTPSPVPATPVPTATPLTESNVIELHMGTRGVAVTNMQKRLVELGYYNITPDGIFDTNDKFAVREFQKQNGLTVDGIAGLTTQLKLYSDSAVAADVKVTATPKPTSTPKPDTTTELQKGSTGVLVLNLQTRLIELGYLTGSADGIYGTGTVTAVKAFQKNNSLTTDGIAGKTTLTKVYSSSAKKANTATATPTIAPSSYKFGDTGDGVTALQERLVELKYLSAADGTYGTATYTAVRNFQSRNGLTSDGVAGAETLKKLNSSSAVAAAENMLVTPAPTTAPTFTAPQASEVRFANWYTEIRTRARQMPNVVIYDYKSGLHWNMNMFSFGKHADSEPITAEDTAIMNEAFGEPSWTPHPVWVIFSDGRVYIATMHNYGHTVDHNANNNLTGHVCIHFPRDLDEAAATGPYALQHQKALLVGWDETQAMIK